LAVASGRRVFYHARHMDWPTLLILAAGLAMDAFAVSVACGLAFTRREHRGAARIAASFALFQAGMPVLGWTAGLALRSVIESVDHWLAFGLLTFLGVRMAVQAARNHRDDVPIPLPDASRLLALSVATSIDALAVGLTLSLLRSPIGVPAVVIGGVTFLISYLGIVLGHELESLLHGRARRDIQVAGGIVLVAIGCRILWQHLS
jgi:manganese efflux pump family protein